MTIDSHFKINYELETVWGKDLFLFVNHKTAALCWAKLKAERGDVLTFDSHTDFHGGFLINRAFPEDSELDDKDYLRSKHLENKNIPHFRTSEEFMEWDLLDNEENKNIVEKQHRFFTMLSDNFIDVAFMKNVVGDVYSYYLDSNVPNGFRKCDDAYGKDHYFIRRKIDEFTPPKKRFILDIDLDFFATGISNFKLLKSSEIIKYLNLMQQLGQKENCKGVTIALEPSCCGSKQNCLKICKLVSEVFEKDILSVAEDLLNCT